MRFLFGVLVGVVLTVIVVYVLDLGTDGEARKNIVNWDVVGEKLSVVTAQARQVWDDFTREITGPP